jgi:hypothetical protein
MISQMLEDLIVRITEEVLIEEKVETVVVIEEKVEIVLGVQIEEENN